MQKSKGDGGSTLREVIRYNDNETDVDPYVVDFHQSLSRKQSFSRVYH